jgi:hypothetical protein
MRTWLIVITIVLGLGGFALPIAPRAHAASCEGCNGTASDLDTGTVARRTIHRSQRAKGYRARPIYGVELPGCFWRKMRLWDPDGQYFLVSRIQFCR